MGGIWYYGPFFIYSPSCCSRGGLFRFLEPACRPPHLRRIMTTAVRPLTNVFLLMPVVKSTTDRRSAAADSLATPLAASLGRHGMAATALLYVTAHRPLAFAAGHLLAVAAPVAAVLGAPHLMDWAQIGRASCRESVFSSV